MVCRGWGRGKGGGVSVQSMGEMGKDFCPNFLNRFLKTLTEGAVKNFNQVMQIEDVMMKICLLDNVVSLCF